MSSASWSYHENLLLVHNLPAHSAQPNPVQAPKIPSQTTHPTTIPDPPPTNGRKDSTPNPSKDPTNMPSKPPSDSISLHQEIERTEKQDLFDDCFSPPPLNNLLCANVLYAPAPLVYRSKAEKYFFDLKPLHPQKFLTADWLFHTISTISTSDAHIFYSHPPDPDQNYAIVPYSHQYTDIPLTTPSLSPQYLHPPNKIISPICIATTTSHPPFLKKTSTTSNAPANFDCENMST